MSGNTPKLTGLGLEMKRAREARDIGLRELARRLDISPATLSRWEAGTRVPTPHDVARYLAEIGADPNILADLVDTAAQPDSGLWLAIGLPEQRRQLNTVLEIERSATKIVTVASLLIPGLLQTADYARAIMTAAEVPADDIETRVAIRLGRRHALARQDAAKFVALIGQGALRQLIGGAHTMAEQLRDLLRVSELPNVDIRIVPDGVGWHPGLEGSFDYAESTVRPAVVHLENRRSGLFFHRPEDTRLYGDAITKISRVAATPEQSCAMIMAATTELE